jgi:hypothetical protein
MTTQVFVSRWNGLSGDRSHRSISSDTWKGKWTRKVDMLIWVFHFQENHALSKE